jgi:uncharacterized Zn finger protein
MWYDFRPYVSVGERKQIAQAHVKKLAKKGHICAAVKTEGRKIATSFWGKAWCDHLEGHCDFENRLPRGRTYVRNGSVFDLQISKGQVKALVSGSEIYEIKIDFKPLQKAVWERIKKQCAGQIASTVELLQGKFSDGVMRILTDPAEGMFPTTQEIGLDCSCPDWADMCKHVAAALYGVGNRLDTQPELLFTLRGVDLTELLAAAGSGLATQQTPTEGAISESDLSAVFGIEIDGAAAGAESSGAVQVVEKAKRVVKAKTGKKTTAVEVVRKESGRPGRTKSTPTIIAKAGKLKRAKAIGVGPSEVQAR